MTPENSLLESSTTLYQPHTHVAICMIGLRNECIYSNGASTHDGFLLITFYPIEISDVMEKEKTSEAHLSFL